MFDISVLYEDVEAQLTEEEFLEEGKSFSSEDSDDMEWTEE